MDMPPPYKLMYSPSEFFIAVNRNLTTRNINSPLQTPPHPLPSPGATDCSRSMQWWVDGSLLDQSGYDSSKIRYGAIPHFSDKTRKEGGWSTVDWQSITDCIPSHLNFETRIRRGTVEWQSISDRISSLLFQTQFRLIVFLPFWSTVDRWSITDLISSAFSVGTRDNDADHGRLGAGHALLSARGEEQWWQLGIRLSSFVLSSREQSKSERLHHAAKLGDRAPIQEMAIPKKGKEPSFCRHSRKLFPSRRSWSRKS